MTVTTRVPAIKRAQEVMGTVVSYDLRLGAVPLAQAYLALAWARAGLHQADAVFSTWKRESPINLLRRGEINLAEAPPDIAEVLERCEDARARSRGWFDPWALPGGVDPTGMVKGWAAQRALDGLRQAGIEAAMVNAGGDIAVCGEPEPGRSWHIGIRDPWQPLSVAATVAVTAAVATSGCYERGAHVVNPRSGEPASAVASATVTGPDLGLADALATALVAAGPGALDLFESSPGYEALLVGHDRSLTATPGFPLVTN